MNLDVHVALLKTSLNDYPGKIASVVFFPFCNLRCPWCHNGPLIKGETKNELISLGTALSVIESRAHLISAVVLSGGEPSLFDGLSELIKRIKKTGLLVKLDTNGLRPAVLKRLIQEGACPDFFAMDLKIAPERYVSLALPDAPRDEKAAALMAANLVESARIIKESGADYEFRSLVFPPGAAELCEGSCAAGRLLFDEPDIAALAELAGSGHWRIRSFRGGSCLDPRWNSLPSGYAADVARLAPHRLGAARKDCRHS
ncbi:MAG: anaerobic ribonucleoside-triphosphate reductase activating protein [Spirochaetaceae bacterium]|jgi:pyruvate formate lyase activating enzyme|nr:anaerobic ribonucleoside-triphosphate reductase activating protein [Spirochaetaceae bacterium]